MVDKDPTTSEYQSYKDWQRAIHSIPLLNNQYFAELAKCLDMSPSIYPFASVHHAVYTLYFSVQSDADQLSFRRKSCLLGYFLMDAELIESLEGFHSCPFDMEVGEVYLVQGHVSFNRYTYFGGGKEHLDRAISQFKLAVPFVPFSTIEMLTQKGFPACALLIWQGQRKMQDVASLEQLRTILRAWLDGQGPLLALNAMRTYCKLCPEEDGLEFRSVLLQVILDWGLTKNRMGEIVDLPLNKEEEEVYVQWIIAHKDNDTCCASYLMFCVLRQQIMDAVKALQSLKRSGRLNKVGNSNRAQVYLFRSS